MGQVDRDFASPAGIGSLGMTLANGLLYLGDSDRDVLFEIDPNTGNTTRTITLPAGNFSDFTFDGTTDDITGDPIFWGVDFATDSIVQFDLSRNILKSFAAPGTFPSGITFDGTSLWVSDSDSDKIFEVNPSDGSVIRSFAAPGTFPLGLAFDGNHLWLNDNSDKLTYRIDISDGSVLETFVSPSASNSVNPRGIEFDDGRLWIVQRDDAMIFRMDSGITDAIDVTVIDGDISAENNFGTFTIGTVQGTIYEDANANGIQDSGEDGLEGWRLGMDNNQNGTLENWEIAALTDSAGSYSFSLPPGTHSVVETVRSPGWTSTTGSSSSVTISSSGETVSGIDFGNQLNGVGPVGTETRVNTTTDLDQFTWRQENIVAMDSSGNTVVVWNGNGTGDDSGVFMQLYDPVGNAVGSEILVNVATAGVQNVPYIGKAADTGQISVFYKSNGTLMTRLFDANGVALSGEIAIASDNNNSIFSPEGIAMKPNGDFVVLYLDSVISKSYPDPDRVVFRNRIYKAQRFDPLGNEIGKAAKVGDTDVTLEFGAGIAMDSSGNFVATWGNFETNVQIFAQRFDASGSSVGPLIIVADSNSGSGQPWSPNVAMHPNGNFIIAWSPAQGDIASQIFNADGTRHGSEFVVAVETGNGNFQGSPGLSILENGGAVLTWESDGGAREIFAQRFDANGIAIDSAPFLVNTTLEALQTIPAVAGDGNGNFTIVWQATASATIAESSCNAM